MIKVTSVITCIFFCIYSDLVGKSLFVGGINNLNHNKKNIDNIIVLIKFHEKGLSFNWNNSTGQIVTDKLYREIVLKYRKRKMYFVDQITNLSMTNAIACGHKLVIGDLAYLLINKIDNLSLGSLLNAQFDAYSNGCPYQIGYIDAISKNRFKLQNQLKLYFHRRLNANITHP